MKILQHTLFATLLLGNCISLAQANPPTLYRGHYTMHWTNTWVLNNHALAAIIAAPLALVFVPYTLATRHYNAENFVKEQKAIESYSIIIQTQQPYGKSPSEQSFTNSDYKAVVKEALTWAKQHDVPHLKTIFKPSIKLVHDEKIYTLRSIKKYDFPKYSPKKLAHWKKLKRLLIARFKLPTSENQTHGTKIKQGILSGFIWTAVSVLIGVPFIPVATLSIPFLALSYHASAKNFVEKPEDIDLYSLTLKIRSQCKTVHQQHFINPDPLTVITQAVKYAKNTPNLYDRIFFEPHIQLINSEKTYDLRRITKAKLPNNPLSQEMYWHKLEDALANRLIIPTTVVSSTPYQGRLTYFGASMALWILFPPLILV